MNLKRGGRETKVAGGIALRPSLWRRIERVAERQGKSKNQVMEEVLSLHVPAEPDSTNLGADSQEVVEFE